MLVLVPTREDVLAIRSIDEAFDLTTTKPQHWEVALIRTALAEGLFIFPQHAEDAADEEGIIEHDIQRVIRTGKAKSKDVYPTVLGRWESILKVVHPTSAESVSKSAGTDATTQLPCTRSRRS
jgi:hypothetical protein